MITDYGPTRIELSATALMRQAAMTADSYFMAGVHALDKTWGEGYAEKHPELVAAFMQTAARDYHSAATQIVGQLIAEAVDRLAGAVSDSFDKEG